ncbi:MAG: hypothetical protein JWQ45_2970 [Blastococcus sp.]|jgi:hypothetical protein|nr:hypothetical protein [Blastococcus sp.]
MVWLTPDAAGRVDADGIPEEPRADVVEPLSATRLPACVVVREDSAHA